MKIVGLKEKAVRSISTFFENNPASSFHYLVENNLHDLYANVLIASVLFSMEANWLSTYRFFFNTSIFGIIELDGNSGQIFEFKGLIHKILRNKELGAVVGAGDPRKKGGG
jgi:hypothetical protein